MTCADLHNIMVDYLIDRFGLSPSVAVPTILRAFSERFSDAPTAVAVAALGDYADRIDEEEQMVQTVGGQA